jgi:hypothetical protein
MFMNEEISSTGGKAYADLGSMIYLIDLFDY